jgi:RNA polymerase sigma-70 factor (ECF subfamily)
VAQGYLDEPGGDSPADRPGPSEPVRPPTALLWATLLHRSYPRLTRPPLNLQADELLGAIVERLLKALCGARPRTARQLFVPANQHMRWGPNDPARCLN